MVMEITLLINGYPPYVYGEAGVVPTETFVRRHLQY
jgi:hypothetical protein